MSANLLLGGILRLPTCGDLLHQSQGGFVRNMAIVLNRLGQLLSFAARNRLGYGVERIFHDFVIVISPILSRLRSFCQQQRNRIKITHRAFSTFRQLQRLMPIKYPSIESAISIEPHQIYNRSNDAIEPRYSTRSRWLDRGVSLQDKK
jgi:hypothetical protein